MTKVYVSSTLRDLKAERQAVIDWLIAARYQPVHSYTPDYRSLRESCLDDVAGCDIYVLILGHRYGHQPENNNPESLSITHLEYRQAKTSKIPIIALLQTGVPNADLPDVYDPEQTERVKSFRAEVCRDVRPAEFSDVAGLIHALSAGIGRVFDQSHTPAPSATELRKLFHRASADLLSWQTTLPNNQWLERPELDILLQRIGNEGRSLTLLLGDPGCGKSALLARLGQRLEADSVPMLGIKLDFVPESVRDQNDLKEYLGLPIAVADCISILAQEGKVVVLVDQLDALADLVVQHSDRLRVPLELIRGLAELDNVHIVASCRVFEHRHDPRLRNLEAELLTLTLPAWEKVDAALQASGVRTAAWNEAMREDLRSPHALDTFLRLLKTTDETELLQGYQHMLESLWQQSVLCDVSGNRRRLLLDMAERMASHEVLWLPLAVFEDRYATILELKAAGILVEESGRIGYRHQTLFEFVRARTFLEAGGRLTEVVLARQDSLRIRPQIWHALGYMRAVDRHAYLDEIRRLWDSDLRPHIRMLLIEFLGQLQNPEPVEASLFFKRFDDAWYLDRILASVVGSQGWFARLASVHLPMLMVRPAQEAWRVVPILIQALSFDQPTVLKLIDTHWLPEPDKDGLTWQVLERVNKYQPDIVDRCCSILARTNVAAWTVNHVAGAVSMQLPDHAPRMVAAWLKREWERQYLPERQQAAQTESNESSEEKSSENVVGESPLEKRYRKVLEGHELHDLPALAEAAPAAFLNVMWSWFVEAVAMTAQGAHTFVVGYRQDHYLLDDIDDEEIRTERPILTAILRAVEELAKSRPSDFLSFVKTNEATDLMLVQRLLAKGLVHIVSAYPDVALEYLCADPRRLVLGPYSDIHRNSKELIQALVPYLNSEQFQRIEQVLLSWNRYIHFPHDDDAKTRHQRLLWTREHRLRLLKALPREKMSSASRRYVEEEERAFPQLRDKDVWFSGLGWVGSPVSAEQMESARDEDILNLFAELTDAHDWDHPRKMMKGGAIQAGREFAKLAEKYPERAVQLVRRMQPVHNEIPTGHVLEALAKTNYDRDALYGLILELAEKGFTSEHYRGYAAGAIEKVVDAEHPLPDGLFDLLESWLVPLAESAQEKAEISDEAKERQDSLLWGHGGITVLPHGNFQILAALSKACLQSRPPKLDRWLDILQKHLSCRESSRVWSAMSSYLQWLHLADRSRAQVFLDQLFLAHPAILDRLEIVRLLAYCQRWIEPDVACRWLDKMLREGHEPAVQGMGEVLVFRHVLFPAESWVTERLNDLVGAAEADDKRHVARIGIAYSVAHLWGEPQHRTLVHGYLMRLLQDKNECVLNALASIFRRGELLPDQASSEFLGAICNNPAILRNQQTEYLGESLETLVHLEPSLVSRVCNAFLDMVGESIGGQPLFGHLMNESLITIALALQDLGAQHQAQGTALFERMLEFNVPQAQSLLFDLDKRTPQQASAASIRRRKWKRGRK